MSPMDRDDLVQRVRQYADRKGMVLGERLGAGIHVIVFTAEYQTEGGRSAVKGHERQRFYTRERDIYLRLRELDITVIRGCHVPVLIDFDDELWVIEMTVVGRPFVLDFAGANLDHEPDFSDEVLADCAPRNRNNSVRAGRRSRPSWEASKPTACSCST